MRKVYRDEALNLTVEDLSGVKPIEKINLEFEGNFVDVTPVPLTPEQEAEIKSEKENRPEYLIRKEQEKILRNMAIEKLKKDGKIPEDYGGG